MMVHHHIPVSCAHIVNTADRRKQQMHLIKFSYANELQQYGYVTYMPLIRIYKHEYHSLNAWQYKHLTVAHH